MAQIITKFIAANAVTDAKIRLRNNQPLRARNAADSADIDVLKVNASDAIEFASVPQVTADPSAANDVARKSYVDTAVSGIVQPIFAKESKTLGGGDITNQYVDLAETIKASSLLMSVNGVVQAEGSDYTVSLTGGAGGVTRVTFAGDLATGGAAELIAADVLRLSYAY